MEVNVRVKNMLCSCCVELLKIKLEGKEIRCKKISIGEVCLFDDKDIPLLSKVLNSLGMSIVEGREEALVEVTKSAVFDLIHKMNNLNSIVKKSEYIVEKTGTNYHSLSKLFSKHTGVTLERYIILNKIERIKELILNEDYTLSEIAYMMDYSSVHYLSSQFKKETGFTVSEFKKMENKPRVDINNIV